MARALNSEPYAKAPQYTLTVPTIQVAFPIKEIHYTIPVPQKNHIPTQEFHTTGIKDIEIEYDDPPPPPIEQRPHTPQFAAPQQKFPPQSVPQNLFSNGQRGPPGLSNVQYSSANNYGPPFNPGNSPHQYAPPHPPNRPSLSYLPITGAFGAAPKVPRPSSYGSSPNSHSSQLIQHQSPSVKVPVLLQNPIPFPLLSTNLIPPIYPYQPFNDGKNQESQYQVPKKQNVVVTISEQDESVCKKCREQTKLNDSEPSSAQHTVTEQSVTVHPSTHQYSSSTENNQHTEKDSTQFEVMKSIPLAEYLASVEYPMQIIQAPILDVPDLPKYFNLGFQNFPHLQQKLNEYQSNKHNSQSFSGQNVGHALFVNNGLQHSNNIKSSLELPSTSTSGSPTTESSNFQDLPKNHKLATDQQSEENVTPSYLSSTNQLYQQNTKELDVNGKGSTTAINTDATQHQISTKGDIVTEATKPHTVTLVTELQLPTHERPETFLDTFNTSSLDQQSNTFIQREPATLQFLSPPPLTSGPSTNWMLHSSSLPTLSPWASTPPPRPFHSQPSHKPRFPIRPAPLPIKKTKQIHQIIVPYTTNKNMQQEYSQNSNNQGWTPLPPNNQGRKVPPIYSFGERLPTTGAPTLNTDNPNNDFKSTDSHLSKIPLSATGSEIVEELTFPSGHASLNISPEVMNQILKQWPIDGNSGTGGFQHILAENLQAILSGEQDSIDFVSLQKNIDNWTAEGYKQNSPSAHFNSITTLHHLAPSKKIPEEYFTTESTFNNITNLDEDLQKRSTVSPFDYEASASQNHLINAESEPHIKFTYKTKDEIKNDSDIQFVQEQNGWSLLDTKMRTNFTELKFSSNSSTTEIPVARNESKEKLWDKIPVSISPLTNEKVYVVTPVTYVDSTTVASVSTKNTTSISSSRVERSYSVQRSNNVNNFLHLTKTYKVNENLEGSNNTENTSKVTG